jgi:exosortase
MALGWGLWAQGYRFQIETLWHLGAIVLIAGSVITFLGADAFWNFLPAWGALLFAVPMAGRVRLYLASPMEQLTAEMTQSVAEILGINCGRAGNQLSVNGVPVCIAEACNGLRMIITLFMACYVFAFARPLRWWVRLIILVASPLVAVASNVIRLVPTLWMFGHASNTAAERFHDLAGWGMLVVAFGILTGITSLFRWIGLPVQVSQGAGNLPTANVRVAVA